MKSNSLESEFVRLEAADSVASIHVLGGTINYTVLETILNVAEQSKSDPNIRALAISIAADGSTSDQMGELPQRFRHRAPTGSHGIGPVVEQAVLRALQDLMKPTIAFLHDKVNGLAIDLAAACDILVANESMTLQDTRILQGRTVSSGITYLLPKLIGQSQAVRILLLGETLSAKEAHRIHLVHRVVADDEFESFVRSFSNQIAAMATRAWEIHKMQVLGQRHLDFESAMIHSLGIRQTHVINDRREGIQAWRERREPRFSGD